MPSAVRVVLDHEGAHPWRWAAALSLSAKIGCSAQLLLDWVKRTEADIHRREPRRSFEAVTFAMLEWANWLNKRRLLEPSGYLADATSAHLPDGANIEAKAGWKI